MSFVTGFSRQSGKSLQAALLRSIITAIGEGRLVPGQFLPPSRVLAMQLAIARNTVSAAYDDLIERGVLEAKLRHGVFVSPMHPVATSTLATAPSRDVWSRHLKLRPLAQRNIVKPTDWQRYPYPFVYGQVDPALFPLADWRVCSRDALGRDNVNLWAADHATADDPMLIDQICRHILPRRAGCRDVRTCGISRQGHLRCLLACSSTTTRSPDRRSGWHDAIRLRQPASTSDDIL